MSAGTFYGLITLLLMLVFIGIWLWAWSSRRKRTFDSAARLPLEEDGQTRERRAGGERS